MDSLINREEIRRLEKAAREKDKKHLMEWAKSLEAQLTELIRQGYEKDYQEEIEDSINNFCVAVAYTAKYSETTHLSKNKLPDFMEDLFSTVDMYRTKEYKPIDYLQQLEKSGIIISDLKYNPISHKIITLCGSTRYKDIFLQKQQELTLDGWLVFSVGVFAHSDNVNITEDQKIELDKIHKEKIRLSSAIYVINKDNYIGDSTKSEIDYARKNHKQIMYLEEVNDGNKD